MKKNIQLDNGTLPMSDIGWQFNNSYAHLPGFFYAKLHPIPVRAPRIVILNHTLADSLGLNINRISQEEAALLFSGNLLPEMAHPIAQAYAGHQFGHFTMLGDGRAILLGEHLTPSGDRFDIQLKGSGQTPFSRSGDGRAALAPMLREYIISEAMHALNIPTTRSLAVVATGEPVMRETLLPGAILTRVAASHIRVGTFEYAARLESTEGIKILADYTIARHYSDLADSENPYLSLLNKVIERQASLISKWLLVGFIHGVMNTDNMTISGETIDYGPCAFMDKYDPDTVFSSIDQLGRYRYSNQPQIAQWNLARFAETLLPLIHPVQGQAIALAEEAIHAFPVIYQDYWIAGMREKLGLITNEAEDNKLIGTLLTWMHKRHADYTNTFYSLSSEELPADTIFHDAEFISWHTHWQSRLSRQPSPKNMSFYMMRAKNPAIIPRNHRVEEALSAVSEGDDYSPMQRLVSALANPYAESLEHSDYRNPPVPSECAYQTFCGT